MKFKQIAVLSLAFLTFVSVAQAQQPNTPPPAQPAQQPARTTPAAQPGPTNSVYDYHETFGPPFYAKNGTEYRAADGAPGPKYWQNRADYQLNAHLNDQTNEITGTEVLTYTNNSPQKLGFLWMLLDQNLFRMDSRGTAIVPLAGSRNWGRGQVFDAGDKIKSIKIIDAKGVATDLKYIISDTRMEVFLPADVAPNGGKVKLK